MLKIQSVILLLIITSLHGYSQEKFSENFSNRDKTDLTHTQDKNLFDYIRYGFYGSGTLNHHISNFQKLPNIPNCCVDFHGNDAFGYSGGGVIDFPIDDRFTFEFRAGYINQSARLHEENFIGNAIIGNTAVPAYSEHSINAHLSSIEVIPQVRYKIFSSIPMYVHGGFSLGTLIQKSYEQQETLIRPSGITFSNGSRVRNYFSGDLPDVYTIQPSLFIGASYDFDLNSSWNISPEIQFAFPFNTLIKNLDWKVDVIKFGVVLRLHPTVFEQSLPIIVQEQPKSIPHYLNVKLDAVAVNPDGTRDKDVHLQIDEIRYTEMYPLLPYIFFSKNNSDLYQTRLHILSEDQIDTFDETKLSPNTIDVYSDLLNIVGKRLTQFPNSSITITGCNNNIDIEANNLKLSNERAESIKKYLIDNWKIDPLRIKSNAQNLPSIPTRNDAVDGQIENRHAEIHSDDYQMTAPVRIEEIKRKQSIPIIEFVPSIETNEAIKKWDFFIEQNDKVLYSRSGSNSPEKIEWNPQLLINSLEEDTIRAVLTVQDKKGFIQSITKYVPVTIHHTQTRRYQVQNNIRIERYGLILFDFDRANISDANKMVLDSVKSRISSSSRVIIQGYADRTGTKEYNKSLAAARCESVRDYLKNVVREDQIKLEAIGSDELIFYNELPEGRNYNRIVYITIETPE